MKQKSKATERQMILWELPNEQLSPECPFCNSGSKYVVPADEKRTTWWCNFCSGEFDDNGDVVVDEE